MRALTVGSSHPNRASEKNPDKDNRGTPRQLFAELDYQYRFTVDVASTHENALCAKHYTTDEDGLAQSWQGETVWCNPPFSNIAPWVRKAALESLDDCRVVMLIPAWTELGWFHDYVIPYASVKFLRGRLSFVGMGGAHAPFACLLAIYPKAKF